MVGVKRAVSVSSWRRRAFFFVAILAAVALLSVVPRGDAFGANDAYIANSNSNNVSVIDIPSRTLVATVPVGASPIGVAATVTRVYVANSGSNTVSVINTSTRAVIATINVGLNPNWVALNPAGTRAYVTNFSVLPRARVWSPAFRRTSGNDLSPMSAVTFSRRGRERTVIPSASVARCSRTLSSHFVGNFDYQPMSSYERL